MCMTTNNNIEQLFKAHYSRMWHIAMMLLRDEDAAKDIVHDAFASLLSANHPTSDLSETYLLSAVRHRCINHIRHLSVRQRFRQIYSKNAEEAIENEDWPDEETIAMLNSAVGNLSEACGRVVKLRFTDGLSYKRIAETLGISEVAVYKHLRHAIDVLREKLSQNG